MTLQFVNHKGEPLGIVAGGKSATKRPSAATDAFHKGWVVMGFSPAHLAEARRLYEAQFVSEGDLGKPFDEVAFMRNNKPKPARSKPYEVHDAAEQCAVLMRRAGWKVVTVVAKAKGGR